MTERSGRCLCGAVRFTLATEPLTTRVCWCRDCQHLAANGTVNLLVQAEGLSVSGALAEFTRTADSAPAWACLDPILERVGRQPLPPKPAPTAGQA